MTHISLFIIGLVTTSVVVATLVAKPKSNHVAQLYGITFPAGMPEVYIDHASAGIKERE